MNFFPITFFFYVYDFTDIDECKGNHSCHVSATCLDHMFVNVTLDILEMDETAQVIIYH